MERRLRVLFVLHTLDYGGAEQIVVDFIKRNRTHITPAVLVLDSLGPLASQLRDLGAAIYFTERRSGLDLTQIGKIKNICREFSPDIIHAHQYTPLFYSLLGAYAYKNIKIIFTEHGRHFPDKKSFRRKAFNRILAKRISAITAVSEFTKRALVENEGFSPDAIEVIYNGVDRRMFDFDGHTGCISYKEELGLDCRPLLLVHIGGFRAVKNQRLAIEALLKVLEAGEEAFLVFIGDGPLLSDCSRFASRLGVDRYIKFLGKKDRNEVLRILLAADIVLNTSLSEACSLAILEAMCAGKAVVASRVGGTPEIINDGVNGLLFESGDADGLAERLTLLISRKDLRERLGKEGKRLALDKFSVEKMDKAYLALYNRVLKKEGERCIVGLV